ncbi:complement C1q-like protein 4 [Cheilinus undulatus]|uniref:complement C1q-like protein 4 n=1 Tax=Cheilinus undulatus TaxID=241271 RepID=UPI001BD64384|nr:complement C1q-like protein 4 [Cheilinus undulatus]
MITLKVFSFFIVVLFETSSTSAVSAERIPRQTVVTKQGAAVLFYASYQGSLRDIEYNPIIFNDVVVNLGSAYSNATGMFTAPVDGIYQFVFAAQLCRGDHNNVWGFMLKGVRKMACHAQVSGTDTTLNTCFLMQELKKGDKVSVKQFPGSCAWASTTSRTITFSGVLLASEGVSMLGVKYVNSCPLPGQSSRLVLSDSTVLRAALLSVVMSLLMCWLLCD